MFEGYDADELRRLLTEPSFFVEEFIGVTPLPYQRNFLDTKNDRRLFVAGRQVGKSRAAAWLAIWHAVTHEESLVLILAKAQRQSMELFRTLKREMRMSDASDEWGVPRETQTEVEFDNGSRILCLPTGTDGANIRGYSADLLMVDEAAFVPEAIFQEVLMPMLAVEHEDEENQFVMTSTPLGKKGFFYNRFDDARRAMQKDEDPRYHVTHAKTEDNPYVKPKFIVEQENALSPMQFKQEILGKFVEASDAYFTTEEVLHDEVALNRFVQKSTQECYLGADIAHTGDDSSVFISMDGDGNVYDVLEIENQKLTGAMQKIRDLDSVNNYDKIMVDATGMGQGVVDQLEEDLGYKVEGFVFSGPKKSDLYSTLKDSFQKQRIHFHYERNTDMPEVKMYNQLTALEYKYTETGRMKIGHPSGGHDDFCDALALANWASHERPFTPSDRESMKPFNLGSVRGE